MIDIENLFPYGPDWIQEECPDCKFGIKNSKTLEVSDFTYIDRAAQFKRGELEFCDCIAGISYRAFLERSADDIIQESSQAPTIRWAGPDGKQTMGSK